MAIQAGDLVVMHTLTNVWYYGRVTGFDGDCVSIDHASYGHQFLGINPPDHPDPPPPNGGWSYFNPTTEIMWMSTAIYWIAKVSKIPIPPEGEGHL